MVNTRQTGDGWGPAMLFFGLPAVLVLCVGPGVLGTMFFDPVDLWPYAVTVGGGIGVPLVVAAVAVRRPLTQLVGYLLAFVLPFWATGILFALNQWLDGSPTVQHRSQIVEYRPAVKGPNRCVVTSWRNTGTESLRMQWGSAISSVRCSPGTTLVIATRQGAFGWDWVSSVRAETR